MSSVSPGRRWRRGARFSLALLLPAAMAIAAIPALALTGPGTDSRDGGTAEAGRSEVAPADGRLPTGPRAPHKAPKDKRTQLEGLFAALKAAPDDRSAKIIGDRLDQLFNTTDSASVDLLMVRATVALEAKQYDLALKILGQAIEIDPDDIGARSKRATVYYLRDDYGPALADIREVLAREPRHYATLYGLALIMRDMGDDKRALEALRKALAVNPRLDGAKELESQLATAVEGREI
ncbi:tetratricopeptide repeat protein [Xanthobacter agilis]|nr:tetratricopeptide repeat protein [Xanthobacter agilis]